MLRREFSSDPFWEDRAAQAVAHGVEVRRNEHGVYVSVHTCATCGDEFTVCPPSWTFGPGCLAATCASYDPARDAEIYFTPDDPTLIER